MAQWPQAASRKAALAARPGPRPIAARLALPAAHQGVIEGSHQRCTAMGLSRIERPDYAPQGRPDLALVRERTRRLHSHAAPVMEMLSGQVAGTESMVVLCDCTGTVIHSIGDDDFLCRASKVALQPGENWSEQAKATNAIGTALMEEVPTLVHADEHFMPANQFLTCSAAPILDPRGNILGVLDVTGDHRSYHSHTMALVTMSARMIGNPWLGDDHGDAMRLHFHHRAEFIGTLMEGIVAVTPEGRIVGANRSALAAAVHLQAANGCGFMVLARFGWPAWSARGEGVARVPTQVPAAPRRPPVPVATPSLAELDSGDPHMATLLARVRRVRRGPSSGSAAPRSRPRRSKANCRCVWRRPNAAPCLSTGSAS